MGDATPHALGLIKGLPRHFTVESLRVHLLSRSTRTPSGCLEFRGFGTNRRIHQKGPGRAWAHIAAYVVFVGDYDPTLDIDHACNNPPCIEPSHLRQMTHAENTRRSSRSGCGHPRERNNVGNLKPCLPCAAQRQRLWRERQAARTAPELEQFRPWVVDPPRPLFTLVA